MCSHFGNEVRNGAISIRYIEGFLMIAICYKVNPIGQWEKKNPGYRDGVYTCLRAISMRILHQATQV